MLRKGEVLTAIGTLGCAMGIGFVMQSSDVAEQRYGRKIVTAEVIEQPPAPPSTVNVSQDSLLKVEDITLTSAAYEETPEIETDIAEVAVINTDEPQPQVQIIETVAEVVPAPTDYARVAAAQNAPKTISVTDATCDINARATAMPAAMVTLTVTAPCQPSERVTIHHNGMMFSEKTSETGNLFVTVPALMEEAAFIVAFSSGAGAIATTRVEDVDHYDRAVLQWKGDAGFQIHAREFGAGYGADGHVWEKSPGDVNMLATGDGGLLNRYGSTKTSDPLLAEVYTFPRNIDSQSGEVILTVEAEVTEENCGIEVEAQALDMQTIGEPRIRNLILPVPSCDSVGSFLVLNNLLQNLKVTAK